MIGKWKVGMILFESLFLITSLPSPALSPPHSLPPSRPLVLHSPQAYTDAQSRARDVEMLVRSLNEVSALFQDLAVLVQHQSEMLDSIEENVETAGEGGYHYWRSVCARVLEGSREVLLRCVPHACPLFLCYCLHAGKYVRKGNDNLRGAIEAQKKARRCMCW